MRVSRPQHWPLVVALILLGCGLRLYHLGASPLRGDEAFTVRYWAAPPAEVLSGLAWTEPHPFGAFFGFWAWKTLVGDSEIAMRCLPALINLLGIPAQYALGHRLFADEWVAFAAALLWAVNPFQIWHAQDVRNYAIWSALSALAMWLLICACDRRRRIDWALYITAAAAALYIFFLEAVFALVGAVYVLVWQRAAGRAWRRALLILAALLIPWLGQLWALAHTGYKGTASTLFVPDLWTRFLPALFVGEVNTALFAAWPLLLILLALGLLILIRRGLGHTALFLIIYTALPAIVLSILSTRIAIFAPRYLLAAAPPLLLLVAYGLVSLLRRLAFSARPAAWAAAGAFGLLFVALPLYGYWHSGYRKAYDWFGLRDYLVSQVKPGDLVLLTTLDPTTGYADPAFDYYYHGLTDVYTLPRPQVDSEAFIRQAAAHYRAIWFVPSGPYSGPLDQLLRADTQLIRDQGAGYDSIVREYRSPVLKPDEIEHPREIHSGGFTLRGYSIEQSAQEITLLLFWQPGANTTDTVFVHLIGGTNATDNAHLWSQEDHPPLAAARDVYHLSLAGIPPGDYAIEIGLYDPANPGQRRALTDGDGKFIGGSAVLTNVHLFAR